MFPLTPQAARAAAWGIILFPLLGAVICGRLPRDDKAPRGLGLGTVAAAFCAFACSLALCPNVFMKGGTISAAFPLFLSGIRLQIDGLGLFFALFTSLIWALAGVFNNAYLREKKGIDRYRAAWLSALAANLGAVLAGDLLTFFVFFELLGLSAYPLIVHSEEPAALRAGTKYITMTLLGEIALLLGILIIYSGSGSLLWPALWLERGLNPAARLAALVLIFIGLGVKAGVMPLHIWLPDAHPAAPTPASALLSGVMIKAGVYGMLRIAQAYLASASASPAAAQGSLFGYGLLWMGLASMLCGVTMALLQGNAKRLLAFHSISQMGYIVMGIGLAMRLGQKTAFLGSIYHTLNHALFKSALFLIAGVIYWHRGEVNLKKLGGLRKPMPMLFLCALIASAGISGLPPFNGYISKTLLHTALGKGLPGIDPRFFGEKALIKIIFTLTGAGTLASFIKFITFIFILPPQKAAKRAENTPRAMGAPLVVLALLICAAGVFPSFFLDKMILPAAGPDPSPTMQLHFWGVHELGGAGTTLLLGGLLFAAAFYGKLFYRHWKPVFFVDSFYRSLARAVLAIITALGAISRGLERLAQEAYREILKQEKRAEQWHRDFKKKSEGHWRCIKNRWQKMEEDVVCYCQKMEKELASKSIESLQKVEIWPREARRALHDTGHEIGETPQQCLSIICKKTKELEMWLMRKGEAYKPISEKEKTTPMSALRYIAHFYNRDLSLALLFILLILIVYLISVAFAPPRV